MRVISLVFLLLAAFASPSHRPRVFDASPTDGVRDVVFDLLPRSETVDCATDGAEGKRILPVYLHPSGGSNDYWNHVRDIRQTLSKIDDVWDEAADPYDQHPRWACTPETSLPSIRAFTGPPIGTDGTYTFGDVSNALANAGLDSTKRIYLVFADHISDAFALGGQATLDADDRASAANENNTGPAYAMIDAEGKGWRWTQMWSVAMHELGHALGAVQCSAPHSSCAEGESGHHHCWDEFDVMCYADGGSYYAGADGTFGTSDDREPSIYCPATTSSDAEGWDCGKDDYFNVAPDPGSYLASHWNLRNSGFVTPLFVE